MTYLTRLRQIGDAMTSIKGWKCFDENLKCRDMQFEVGSTYEVSGPLKMCENGLHFHTDGTHLFNYYSNSIKTRVCEIEASEALHDGDKSCARRIKIVRELGFIEICILRYGSGDGYGYGYGSGDGYGYGSGYGYGYGYGSGDGYGYGSGDGYGYGYGSGDGSGKYAPLPNFINLEEKAA